MVFDLFHTLVDPEDFRPRDFRRLEQMAALLEVDLQPFAVYWRDTAPLRNRQGAAVRSLLAAYLRDRGRAPDPQRLDAADQVWGQYQDQAVLQPRPDVVSALQALGRRGLKLGVLSVADEREVRAWPRSPLAPWFTAACFSCAIGAEKPEPEAYQAVLGRLGGIAAEQAVFVGDGGSLELQGARAAGFGLVVFMRGFVGANGLRTEAELVAFAGAADAAVDSLAQLSGLLPAGDR